MMASLEKRVEILEQQVWSNVENLYYLQLSCDALVADRKDMHVAKPVQVHRPQSYRNVAAKQGGGSSTEPLQLLAKSIHSNDERLDAYEQRLAGCEKACADNCDALAKLEDRPLSSLDRLGKLPAVPLNTTVSPAKFGAESIVGNRRLLQDREVDIEYTIGVLEQFKASLTETCRNLVTELAGLLKKQFVELQHQVEQQAQFVDELRSRLQDFEPAQVQERFHQQCVQKLQNVENSTSSKKEQQSNFFELDSRINSLEETVNTLQKDMGTSDQNAWLPDESATPRAPDKSDEGTAEKLQCPAVIEHMLLDRNNMQRYVEYDLKESTWDASLFVFLPVYGRGVSIHQCFSLLATLTVQCAFCGVCYINLTNSVFNEDLERRFFKFRVDVGHDNRHVSSVYKQSLIQRLCERDEGLETVSSQLTYLQNIDGYLGRGDASFWEKWLAGPLMCISALTCWAFTVSAEFRKIEACSWAMLSVPAGPWTHVTFNTADENVHLDSVSSGRRIFGLAICIMRVIMTGFLLYVGGAFLAHESSVSDLLLNTVALEFVLHLDELVFAAFAPGACTILLSKMQPLEFGPFRHVGGWELRLAREVICIVSFVVAMYTMAALPMITSMNNIETALCHGYKAFAFTTDLMGFAYVKRLELSNQKDDSSLIAFMQESIISTIDQENPNTPRLTPYAGYGFSASPKKLGVTLEEISSYGFSELVDFHNPTCADRLNSSFPFNYRAYVLNTLNRSVSSCEDWGRKCWDDDALMARTLCPRSCTCDDPLSPTFSANPRNGCPTSCTQTQTYIEKRGNLKCQDWTLQEFHNSSFWYFWVRRLRIAAVLPGHTQAIEALQQIGCDAINVSGGTRFWRDYCYGTVQPDVFNVRPLGMVCPQACGCNGSVTIINFKILFQSCPSSCPALSNFLR